PSAINTLQKAERSRGQCNLESQLRSVNDNSTSYRATMVKNNISVHEPLWHPGDH
uniref:Uncharacterized protein n=3 Tax=Aegilops tauschii TaxID=37682 RepID=A0A452ZEZ7_AEGTS